MYLPKRPTIFTKDGQIREVFHSVTASELLKAGWSIQGEDETSDTPDAVADGTESQKAEQDNGVQDGKEELESHLNGLTKAGLVEFSEENGVKIDPHATKAVIIETILESIDEVERI